ncbi:Cytosolic copper metallochaperone [Diaporthe eres]|uniref:Cytosolic copper metallochaperone n=1 Tax=Diaporthe eres TaxID=83184 RepID=A0ABR1P3V4_DIAER
MSCQGCANTVKKGLEPITGIQAINTSVDDQTVTVTANAEVLLDDVFKAIQATGKEVKNGRVKTTASCWRNKALMDR